MVNLRLNPGFLRGVTMGSQNFDSADETPAVKGVNTDGGFGIHGVSTTNHAVHGESTAGRGVVGTSETFLGVFGHSVNQIGVAGVRDNSGCGFGKGGPGQFGVHGVCDTGHGVHGDSVGSRGVVGTSQTGQGVLGTSVKGEGVVGGTGSGIGVKGDSDSGIGVHGRSNQDVGVMGFHGDPRLQEIQLPGLSQVGVFGASENGAGVMGYASRPGANVFGVVAFGGLLASAVTNPLAGKFEGNVQVDGDIGVKGDISLPGADCAEHFDVADADTLEPGTLMVINKNGILEQSAQAYDKKVAGVISGAGNHKTGIVLDKQPSEENRKPIALIGKVNCKVDARYSPIEVGDLLTTSSTPGHAMKASEPQKAFGSIIGKALRVIGEGQGLIPILIALQ